MFGIQVSFYFINSLLTITIFQSLLLLLLLQRKWKGEEHVTFLLSFFSVVCSSRQMPCCPGLLWGAAHVKRLEELLTRQILVPFYGIFSSRFFCFSVLVQCLIEQGFSWQEQTSVIASLTVLSYGTFLVQADQPFWSNALSSGAIAEPSPASVLKNCWSGRFLFHLTASSGSNFSHPERPLDGTVCFFHWQIFVTDQRSAQVVSPVNRWPLQRTHAREKLFAQIFQEMSSH